MKGTPHPGLVSHGFTVLAATLVISLIWIGAFLLGFARNESTTNNYITNVYGNNGTSNSESTCTIPDLPKCADTCEFVICESIPDGMTFDPKYAVYNSTTDCWMRLMNEAKDEILLGAYYWSLLAEHTGNNFTVDPSNSSADGVLIYNTLLQTARDRNVNVRIAQSYDADGTVESENLVKDSNGKIQLRSLNFGNWYPGGILHTKSWSVDGKHIYIGSANFDWRSLRQVKELGIAVFNCPCLGQDLQNLLEIYWRMGAPGAVIPEKWEDSLSTGANHESPMNIPQIIGDQAAFISASPPGFRACGREDDLTAMIKTIDDAKSTLDMAVMDFSPAFLYMHDANKWMPDLDNAIRRAAFERGVHVRFMMSLWPHTSKQYISYLRSLAAISPTLPCRGYKGGECTDRGIIEVKLVEVPTLTFGDIPYARVYHNKYFVTETTAYVGTSNWSPDYWTNTAGIGLILRSDNIGTKSHLVDQIRGVFERDWYSNYTTLIDDYSG